MSKNPADLREIVEKLNDTLVERTPEKDWDSMYYFNYVEDYSINSIKFLNQFLVDSDNYDLYNDEKEDKVEGIPLLTGEQKVLSYLKDELENMKKSIELALKIVNEEIYFKS